ncbi:MAG: phosphate-starvation-inducible PsiE family protein [Alcanivoracaceae bacterium]|nr:phosphate-starvation-inducible PsiE family protein [Alcanivoracaceae bacterium]
MTTKTNAPKPVYKTFIMNHTWHSRIVGFFIGILMIAIYLWMASGFINLLLNLYHSFPNNWSHGSETVIKDIVIILALLELIRIFQAYLTMGRIKVTFILDVALVVLIGELISLWYREYNIVEVLLSIFVIAVLVLLRIVTSRFSPDQ